MELNGELLSAFYFMIPPRTIANNLRLALLGRGLERRVIV